MTTATAKKNSKNHDDLGALPEWDLSVFYTSMDAPQVKADITQAESIARNFAKTYEGKVTSLSAESLAEAVKTFEQLQDLLGKLSSYAFLLYAKDMATPKNTQFYQNTSEKITDISSLILFFTLELNKIEEKALQTLIKQSATLQHYAPWIRDVRTFRPYQLADDLEKILHEKSVTGRQAWQRLFDETLNTLRFPFDGKDLSCTEILNLLSSTDKETRKKAAKSFGKVLGDNSRVFAMVTNVMAKDKAIEDSWRKFKRPISGRNVANMIEDEVVEALIAAVKASYPKLSHRYYRMKAKWFGGEKLDYWDRNAPLPEEDDRKIPWDEAKNLVLSAYKAFSPKMAELGQTFFDKHWIDAPVTEGKESGAFSHPTVPSAHPFILMNYQGKLRDVMTLAHELGHGVHQVLAAPQGALMSDTPLTLAETASVFGEQLTFRALLTQTKDTKKRKAMIAAKVEDMLNTVVRQVAFCEFERQVHDERKNGEIPVERISEIWMNVQTESLGPALRFDEEYRHYWSYISHFIHAPFYVYAYAFGDCLVNSLYAVYQQQPQGFEAKYLTMLKAGGTLRHKELLAPFGLDATDPAFWQQGLNIIASFIDELEGS